MKGIRFKSVNQVSEISSIQVNHKEVELASNAIAIFIWPIFNLDRVSRS